MADIQNFPSNSLKVRELKELEKTEGIKIAEKPVKKLQLSAPAKKKTSVGKALKDSFFNKDIPDLKQHIIFEYVVPGIKQLASDVLHSTLDAIFYGGSSPNRRYYRSGGTVFNYDQIGRNLSRGIYNIYNDPYRNSQPVNIPETRSVPLAGYNAYNDIFLANRKDAEAVLAEMNDIIQTYGKCRIADLYQLVGLDHDSQCCKFGWSSLKDAHPTPTRDGWKLELPKPKPLDIIN